MKLTINTKLCIILLSGLAILSMASTSLAEAIHDHNPPHEHVEPQSSEADGSSGVSAQILSDLLEAKTENPGADMLSNSASESLADVLPTRWWLPK